MFSFRYTDRSGHESDKGNQIIEVNEHSGYRYSESQFIDPDRESSRNSSDYDRIERSTFPTKTLSTNSQQNSTKTLPSAKFQQNSRTKLRRSQSLLDGNRRFDRYSDDYNHLDFYRKSTIPKRPVTDENYNKLKAMTSHPYKNLKLGEYKERDSYISLGIDETLLVSGSDFMNINTKDMQKGHSSTTNKKEASSDNVQSDAYIATDHTVDEICSNTSLLNMKCDSLDSTDVDMNSN
ncbi:uncharacterized protein LOC134238284 [Saccostrea cucullata]|uniref:uncharacterized protein LOC134238284 n=1 Tax=Saccostrea cuccullata TaxID=36930 RepID=UPI002ED69181